MKKKHWYDGEGLACPVCRSKITRVMEKRDHEGGAYRRRKCRKGHKFSTVEVYVECEGGLEAAARLLANGGRIVVRQA